MHKLPYRKINGKDLGDLGTDGSIIFKCILKNLEWMVAFSLH
jgi:hypothetical protein